jgi:5-formyltetrahydrofolate cyclo-ligase
MPLPEVRAAKTALRRAIRTGRRARAAAGGRDAAGEALADGALALAEEVRSRTGRVCRVAAYVALPTEPPTMAMLERLRAAGHEVLLPVLLADKSLEWDLDRTWQGPEALATCDLVLTPGLAVDRSGRRLGQGGGSYDRALVHVRPDVDIVTLLWDDELLDTDVPAEPHDRRVTAVLTPGRGLIRLG